MNGLKNRVRAEVAHHREARKIQSEKCALLLFEW